MQTKEKMTSLLAIQRTVERAVRKSSSGHAADMPEDVGSLAARAPLATRPSLRA